VDLQGATRWAGGGLRAGARVRRQLSDFFFFCFGAFVAAATAVIVLWMPNGWYWGDVVLCIGVIVALSSLLFPVLMD